MTAKSKDGRMASVNCVIPQYATLEKHAIQFKSLLDALPDRSLVPIEWIVDVQDEASGWFYATAYAYNDRTSTLHIMVPDKHNPVFEGDIKIDHRLLHLVECVDNNSAALFNKIVRDSIVKVRWQLEWFDGDLEHNPDGESDIGQHGRWLLTQAVCYVRFTNQLLVESPDFFATGRYILIIADVAVRLMCCIGNKGIVDFTWLIKERLVLCPEGEICPSSVVRTCSQVRNSLSPASLNDLCLAPAYRTDENHIARFSTLLTSLPNKSVVPIEWIVDVADKDSGWFFATAYTYNDKDGTLHIMVPDKHNPVFEGDIKMDYRLLHLVECVDNNSAALFNKIVRDSIVKVRWQLEWFDGEHEQDSKGRWSSYIAHYFLRFSNQLIVLGLTASTVESAGGILKVPYVVLSADQRVRMVRCDDKRGLSDFERLIRDGSVLRAPRALDFSHLLNEKMAHPADATPDVTTYERMHVVAPLGSPCGPSTPAVPPPPLLTCDEEATSFVDSDLELAASARRKATPPRLSKGTAAAVPSPRVLPPDNDLFVWLHEVLRKDVDESYIVHCQSCFFDDFIRSKEALAAIPPLALTHDYLKSMGIDKVSVRWIIKRRHSEIFSAAGYDKDEILACLSDISSTSSSDAEEEDLVTATKKKDDAPRFVFGADSLPVNSEVDHSGPSAHGNSLAELRATMPDSVHGTIGVDGLCTSSVDAAIMYRASVAHPDENIQVLKQQLETRNIKPLEFIPLQNIKAEIASLTQSANDGVAYDEERLDFLIACMEINTEYIAEREQEQHAWRERLSGYISECVSEMRSFVPANVHLTTAASLQSLGLPKRLAKRIMTKKCLWLIRMEPSYISRLHEADLFGVYSPACQQLDIVEMTAVYGCLPDKFNNDGNGRKRDWKRRLEEDVRRLVIAKDCSNLSSNLCRFSAYTENGLVGPFQDLSTLFSVDVTSSDGAFAPKSDFRRSCDSDDTGYPAISPRRLLSPNSTPSDDSDRGEAAIAAHVIATVGDEPGNHENRSALKSQLEGIFSRKIT